MLKKPETALQRKFVEEYESIVKEEVNKLDPIGLLAGGAPEDEYKPEIRDITLRLHGCKSFLEISEIMYVVFAYYFDLRRAGPESIYLAPAKEIAEYVNSKKLGKEYGQTDKTDYSLLQ